MSSDNVFKSTKHSVLPQDEKENLPAPERSTGCVKIRYLMTVMLCLASTVCFWTRVNMSITLVAMTSNETSSDTFDWDSKTQSIILSSFFWGYTVGMIPGGLISQALGPSSVLLVGIFINSLAGLVTPISATYLGWGGVCSVRVVQGLMQGVQLPCIYGILSKWAPPAEKGRIMSIVFTGNSAGTVIAFPLGGFLANSSAGWPATFYVIGAAGFAWCILWFFFGANQPSNHTWISNEERRYIENSLGNVLDVKRQFRTPWKSMLTSPAVWALLAANCTGAWVYWTLLTQIPTYMQNILHFDIRSNGLLSALPYLTSMFLSYTFGTIADKLISTGYITINFSRKLFNSLAFLGSTAALIAFAYTPSEQSTVAVILLVIAVGVYTGVHSGFMMNHIDLSPNYCSPMLGFTNCVAQCFSIMAPLTVGFIVTEEGNIEQWRIVFWIAAAFNIIGCFIFIWFGRTNVQLWNDPNYKKRKNEAVTT